MAGKTPSRTRRDNAKAIKDRQLNVNEQVKAAKKRAAQILKKAKTDIRTVRSEVAALKKAGVISNRIDARSYQPTKYMLKKIERNRDILEGKAIAVKAPPKVRKKYSEAGTFETRGGSIIVPKDRENQRAKISRGLIETITTLKNGEERRIALPFKATDLESVANRLRTDPTLNGLKEETEFFGFRIFGHNMRAIGFPDADELGDYILQNYRHLFTGKNAKAALDRFELIRFKTSGAYLPDAPESGKRIDAEWKRRNKQGNEWAIRHRNKRKAAQKAAQRDRETPEQRQRRLDKQRERSRRNREENKRGK